MPQLYPTINLPTLMAPRSQPAQKVYKVAPYFSFEVGDFLFDSAGRVIMADGKETFEQWCIKVCSTERGTRLAYSDKIGTEFEAAMKEPDIEAVKSSVVRTITESILVNPAAEWVKNFSLTSEGDSLWVTFEVKARPWAEASTLTVKI